jgi:hypothetical protein
MNWIEKREQRGNIQRRLYSKQQLSTQESTNPALKQEEREQSIRKMKRKATRRRR